MEFKKINGYDGYEVSNTGVVRSINRYKIKKGCNFPTKYKGKELSYKNIRGYYNVSIINNEGRRLTKQVHRLVMMSFANISNSNELQVNHIDGNKSNNNLDNLEWVTPKQNIHHAIENGLMKIKEQSGSKNAMAKLKEKDVLKILNLSKSNSRKDIAKIYNVSRQTIDNIINKKGWASVKEMYLKGQSTIETTCRA